MTPQQPSLKERIATDLTQWFSDLGVETHQIENTAQRLADLCCKEFEGAVKRASSLGVSHPHLANYISSSDLLEAIKELRK